MAGAANETTEPLAEPDGPKAALVWQVADRARRRLGWGIADQAMSSLTNFAITIFIARTLGAVEFGSFSLAFVTYAFMLNASRGLATDPFLVRVTGADRATWRRATASCTGTALSVGIVAGACTLVATALLHGSTRMAFAALGLTLPGLLLQDSWRFAFFADGRGKRSLMNDLVWAFVLLPSLALLRLGGNGDVFWYVLAWGGSASVAAAVGPAQARVVPKLAGARLWLRNHKDLGFRYLVEGTSNSAASQFGSYGITAILGLAAVGYVQAANTLMGPFMVVFFGIGLVALPEAVRALQRAPRQLAVFCALVSIALGVLALAWGAVLLLALPRGLGHLVLGSLWPPTEPLILPRVIAIVGGCVMAGAGMGLHALGAAHRSMRAMVLESAALVAAVLIGAASGGTIGVMIGMAAASWMGALVFWLELRTALGEVGYHDLWPRSGRRPVVDPQAGAARPATHVLDREPPPGFTVCR